MEDSESSDEDNQVVVSTFAAAQEALRNMESSIELFFNSDDEEEDDERKIRVQDKKRDFDAAYNHIQLQYFNGVESIYTEADFENRFRVPRSIFQRIYTTIHGNGMFVRKYDSVKNKFGIHPLVRFVTCFRKLVYGDSNDRLDDIFHISTTATLFSFREFCKLIVDHFGHLYLNRCPMDSDKERCL